LQSLGANRRKLFGDDGEVDPEERERRRKERGKKRYMEDFEFANDEFFNMWKQRTAGKQESNQKD